MSTDTAVLTTKLIINDGMNFKDIQFVDDPEIFHKTTDGIKESIQITGFRYISSNYD